MITSYLIKPASSLCNMRCRYCFYEDEAKNRAVKSMGIMSVETARALIDAAFENHKSRLPISFSFQGGEPTLAGIGFFHTFVDYVQERNHMGIPVRYTIQTNGYALDDDWIEFFYQHKFLVGVSVDGEKAIHDSNRIDKAGKGTWNKVTQILQKLFERGVAVNLLCVVTKTCARSPQKVYASMKKLGAQYLQFIACLDPIDAERGSLVYSLTPKAYGEFLCKLFDLWYRDWEQEKYISIRLFEDFVHLAMGMPAGTCATAGSCGKYLVVEGDGGAYPCDFYALDQWKIGQIGVDSVEAMENCALTQKFMRDSQQHPKECGDCSYRQLCNGGCKRDWVYEGDTPRNYYCPAFKMFFGYAGERINRIARAEIRARNRLC